MKKFHTVVLNSPHHKKERYLSELGRESNWNDVFTLWTDDFSKCVKFKTWDEALSVQLRIGNSPYISLKSFAGEPSVEIPEKCKTCFYFDGFYICKRPDNFGVLSEYNKKKCDENNFALQINTKKII